MVVAAWHRESHDGQDGLQRLCLLTLPDYSSAQT
jgi:hypothetical protein